ncbi:beta-amyloid-like protein [Clonorchis sinensis]|uniref:Beta-amyloid-like protein n=1 Tax=Clonorchis sinensis TaxID=79923 RepID=G7YHW1_CLOSI|nr:beta-amyloid-like protein [Clonorchis sinensis]
METKSDGYMRAPANRLTQKSPLIVPRGCQLKEFGGSSNATCRKSEYWKQLVSEHCVRLGPVEYIKPCIKPDSYLHTHYLGVLAVCCAIEKGKGVVTASPPGPAIQPSKSNFSFPLPTSSKSDDSLIIDQNVAVYQGYLNQLPAPTTMGAIADKSREKQRYSIAKKAGHEAYHRRKHILEQELAEAEAQFSDMDWIHNPEQTQNAENRLHKEFRQKYLALDQEARAIDHDLLLTHQQRVSHSVGKRFEAAALAWDNAVRNAPSNLTQLLSAIEHLQRVVERDRYHLIRRWEHLGAADPLEASRVLNNLRGRLDDVERQFNRSLEKLDRVPLLKDAILHHVAQLRDREYPQLDAMVKSLHHVSMPEADGVVLPTADQEAALEAETIIAKYRHHLPKLDLDNKSGKTNTKPEGNNFASKITRIGEDDSTSGNQTKPPTPRWDLHVSAYDATPSAFGPQHAKKDTLFINDTRSLQGLGTVTKWFLALTAVSGILIATLFVLRYRIRRARLHRAGYSCTVAEVDEITAVDATGVDQSVGLHDDESDRLVNWRFNGYENPAYKYPDNVVRFPRA